MKSDSLICTAFGRAAIQQDKEEERQSGSISFHLKKLGRFRKQFVRKKEALSLELKNYSVPPQRPNKLI
jgi:hypothetical protein